MPQSRFYSKECLDHVSHIQQNLIFNVENRRSLVRIPHFLSSDLRVVGLAFWRANGTVVIEVSSERKGPFSVAVFDTEGVTHAK